MIARTITRAASPTQTPTTRPILVARSSDDDLLCFVQFDEEFVDAVKSQLGDTTVSVVAKKKGLSVGFSVVKWLPGSLASDCVDSFPAADGGTSGVVTEAV